MRYSNRVAVLAMALMLAMSASSWAASNHGSVILSNVAQLNGTSVPAGEYKVKWEGSGSDVQVSLVKGKNTVVTAPAKLVDRGRKQPQDAVVISRANGSPSIVEIHLEGKSSVLVFTSATGGEKTGQ